MDIAILGPVYPFRGGIANHTALLCKALQEKGNRVSVYSFRKMYPAFLHPGSTQFDHSQTAHKIHNLRLFTPWNPLSWIKTSSIIKRGRPDALVCIWWTPLTGAGYGIVCRFVKRSGIPILYLLHNALPHERLPMMKGWTRFAFNKADGFITQSSQVEEELLKLCPGAEKLWRRRCPHPMYDFQEFSAPPKDIAKERLKVNESKVLLFFGIVRKYKGLMTLIEAFPEIHRYFKGDVRLLIAGEFYESLTEYVRAIEQTGCADKITLHNRFIPNESVGDYFQAADVVVLPYLTASQSGVTQMAYGFGKPVIASAVGGLPETVEEGETGLLFSLGDSASLAQKVKEFYEKYLNTDWVKNIADLKERFSWTGMVEAIIDFTDEFKVQPPNPFTNYP